MTEPQPWTCALHNVTTTGDCPRCDDELIAIHEQSSRLGVQS